MPNFVKIAKGDIPLWANIYQKLPIFAILVAVSPHILVTAVKFDLRVQTWETLP